MPTAPVESPPVEDWATWHGNFAARWQQGQHVLFVGPTGSGKTVAARELAWDRKFVVVLGTKIKDKELEKYLDDGYIRITDWPASPKQIRDATFDDGSIRLVLWPVVKKREDLYRFRPVYAKALDQILIDGNWAIVADEGLWLSERSGLNLGQQLSAIAYTGRSSGVTLMMLIQRPAGVPRNTWSNVAHAIVYKHGVTSDSRELASLGTDSPKDVALAIRSLQKYQFLYLPCTADTTWAISKVDIDQV